MQTSGEKKYVSNKCQYWYKTSRLFFGRVTNMQNHYLQENKLKDFQKYMLELWTLDSFTFYYNMNG